MEQKRISGILAHPTCFPGEYGIGDLGKTAYEFIDFLHKSGQSVWQVLPLNPTGFGDSPYQSFSTFAGNPLLISPDILLEEKLICNKDIKNKPEFEESSVDYKAVYAYKMDLLKIVFENFQLNPDKNDFCLFCKENNYWLDDFSLFVCIKNYLIEQRKIGENKEDYSSFAKQNKGFLTENEINDFFYGGTWTSWPEDLKNRKQSTMNEWRNMLHDEIQFQCFLQYEFFRQWGLLKQYANKNNIHIIGDIPIFVAFDSADVWANKELFLLDENSVPVSVAGVPPDYFSKTGQLWGNPLYDWKVHERCGFSWWIKRVSSVLKHVDILRIDHFRGFESYWAIPYGEETAIRGKWEKGPGRAVFDSIRDELGDLPIIAEDLGIITEEVEQLRDCLGLPGMKILQFGFDAGKNNKNMPHNLTTTNVVLYTGTHDNDTSVGWYNSTNEPDRDQLRRYMNVSGDDPAWDLIRLAFLSVAFLAIVPIQDVMSLGSEGRMNTPGIASGNWRFRYTSDMLNDIYAERLKYLSDLTDRNLDNEADESDDEKSEDEKSEEEKTIMQTDVEISESPAFE